MNSENGLHFLPIKSRHHIWLTTLSAIVLTLVMTLGVAGAMSRPRPAQPVKPSPPTPFNAVTRGPLSRRT